MEWGLTLIGLLFVVVTEKSWRSQIHIALESAWKAGGRMLNNKSACLQCARITFLEILKYKIAGVNGSHKCKINSQSSILLRKAFVILLRGNGAKRRPSCQVAIPNRWRCTAGSIVSICQHGTVVSRMIPKPSSHAQ